MVKNVRENFHLMNESNETSLQIKKKWTLIRKY